MIATVIIIRWNLLIASYLWPWNDFQLHFGLEDRVDCACSCVCGVLHMCTRMCVYVICLLWFLSFLIIYRDYLDWHRRPAFIELILLLAAWHCISLFSIYYIVLCSLTNKFSVSVFRRRVICLTKRRTSRWERASNMSWTDSAHSSIACSSASRLHCVTSTYLNDCHCY